MLGPPGSARITAATRHNVTSVLVYAAKPPHTPATFLSVLERYNFFIAQNKMEPRSRLELETPSLPWKCSTTELTRHICSPLEVHLVQGEGFEPP